MYFNSVFMSCLEITLITRILHISKIRVYVFRYVSHLLLISQHVLVNLKTVKEAGEADESNYIFADQVKTG